MIQIQSKEQFRKAEERARKERMMVKRLAPRTFNVINTSKDSRYKVTFIRRKGKLFGQCNCEAGTPMYSNRMPLVCKHLYAALVVLRAFSGKVIVD